jgi:pre-mRNA-processing factor 39
MHQYARYFDAFTAKAQSQSVAELVPEELLLPAFRDEVLKDPKMKDKSTTEADFKAALRSRLLAQIRDEALSDPAMSGKSGAEVEAVVRAKLQEHYLGVTTKTAQETTSRWEFESNITRPYYHVTELDDRQLANWRKYLDFEESEGDYQRIRFLYERCVVTAANYDEFWFRYARWLLGQPGKTEEVRNVYERASCIYVPIAKPAIRLFYAHFEESLGRSSVAVKIHEAILDHVPDHLETILSLASLLRREEGVDKAIEFLHQQVREIASSVQTSGALVAELARMIGEVKGDVSTARQTFETYQSLCLDCKAFWFGWFFFEFYQPQSSEGHAMHQQRVKAVYDAIQHTSRLPVSNVREIASYYMIYLRQRCSDSAAMKELMQVDATVHGPASVASALQGKPQDSVPYSTSGIAELHPSLRGGYA